MKDLIINKTMNTIKRYSDFDNTKLAEIKYGLESLYTAITKLVVILFINFLLGSIKEFIYIYFFYGLLRFSGFGLHAKKTSHCWFLSLIILVSVPLMVKYIEIPRHICISLMTFLLIWIIIFAPADTEKHPLINKKKRILYKIICSLNALIYLIIVILSKNIYLSNILLFSLLIQVILVLPITYRILGLKYNNYKNYVRKGGF